MTDDALEARIQAAVDAAVAARLAPMRQTLEDLARQVAQIDKKVPADRVSLLVFSGEMDNLLAAFIVATGAAAMGSEVHMFFTFWGLNALRTTTVYADKSIPEKMIAAMLPSDPGRLPTSRLNLLGVGPVFFRKVMDQNCVESLPSLIQVARDLDVKLVACEMSMGVMGIRRDELIDGVTYGGVAGYLETASDARVTLFI